MGIERNRGGKSERAGPASPRIERQKIPLPPLPQFRQGPAVGRPAAGPPREGGAGALTHEETEQLTGGPFAGLRTDTPSPRTGAIGASVLNDLVEEIERDLERDLARHSPAVTTPSYRRTVGCSFVRR